MLLLLGSSLIIYGTLPQAPVTVGVGSRYHSFFYFISLLLGSILMFYGTLQHFNRESFGFPAHFVVTPSHLLQAHSPCPSFRFPGQPSSIFTDFQLKNRRPRMPKIRHSPKTVSKFNSRLCRRFPGCMYCRNTNIMYPQRNSKCHLILYVMHDDYLLTMKVFYTVSGLIFVMPSVSQKKANGYLECRPNAVSVCSVPYLQRPYPPSSDAICQ